MNIDDALIQPGDAIQAAIVALEACQAKIAVVVDDERHPLGTITDGDVRRALLRGVSIEDRCDSIMNHGPKVAPVKTSAKRLKAILLEESLRQIPLVDEEGRIVAIQILDDLLEGPSRDNWVVIMAGGRGVRLQPLTNARPKPLLNVGNKPILETIIINAADQGFYKFFISLNYRAEMIRDYFGDGSRWNVNIEYIMEEEPLGTAGSLALLPAVPEKPVIVMNGDILTNVNLGNLIDFHADHGDAATMCVREFVFEVPFGVLEIDGHNVVDLAEKPIRRDFVNAGIYVLNPGILATMKEPKHLEITDLLKRSMNGDGGVGAFLIQEYWLDIGRMDDFCRANDDFGDIFK